MKKVHTSFVNKKQPKNETLEQPKHQREWLLKNREMRYVIAPNGTVHDRDCSCTKHIADDQFRMSAELPADAPLCSQCLRSIWIRYGLPTHMARYMPLLLQIFLRLGATVSDLKQLFFDHGARIDGIEGGGVCLRIREDRWCLQPQKKQCLLYHNNYRVINTERRMVEGFHLQYNSPLSCSSAITVVCKYTWSGHLEAKRNAHIRLLQQQLSSVCNYRRVLRLSLWHYYFLVVDADDHLRKKSVSNRFPLKVLKRETCSNRAYTTLLCRIPRFRAMEFLRMVNGIKMHCAFKEYEDYDDYCAPIIRPAKITYRDIL